VKKFILAVLLAITAAFSACGGTACDRLNTAFDKFFAGKEICREGGSSIGIEKPAACKGMSSCSADEVKATDDLASCLSKAQPCTEGNEKKAVSEGMACIFAAAAAVPGSECLQQAK